MKYQNNYSTMFIATMCRLILLTLVVLMINSTIAVDLADFNFNQHKYNLTVQAFDMLWFNTDLFENFYATSKKITREKLIMETEFTTKVEIKKLSVREKRNLNNRINNELT